ncbi:dnaJ homolog subfamily C member 7-like [Drosophila miranda]|uniref:dnaJ homolog subfamily C member 7-like n=1 Tax=Drosophila miranda TaxID=7229 RepID=UPI0007E61C86|nr:dnaJ homolog subfamily C member 7-like [Drosophila miranda]
MDANTLAEIKSTLGESQYRAKNYEAALRSYSEAIDLFPDSAAYYNNRAACYYELLDPGSALADVSHALRIDPGFDKAYVHMAKCCRVLGDLFGMESAVKKVFEADRNSTAVNEEQMALREIRRLEPFIKSTYDRMFFGATRVYLDYILMMAPATVGYRILKAECLAYLNRCDDALEIAADVIRQDPTSADAIFVRGLCLFYTDNVEKCIPHFEHALLLDPEHEKSKQMLIKAKKVKAMREEGNRLFKMYRYREAYLVFTDALAIDVNNTNINSKLQYNRALALVLRGQCLLKLGIFEEAVADFKVALTLESSEEIKKLWRDAKQGLQRLGCYGILGVERNASDDDIRRAFYQKARLHHPDKHASDSNEKQEEERHKFLEVVGAYEMLSNGRKCSRDEIGQEMEASPDLEEMFRSFFWNESIPLNSGR